MIRSIVMQHAFEAVSMFISGVALVYAALAFKAAKHAIQATRDSDMTALRVKVMDGISEAERGFLKLQKSCQMTRDHWEKHLDEHYPTFGRGFEPPKETRHIADLERTGRKLLGELIDRSPITGKEDALNLEDYIRHAQFTSVQIERLNLSLEMPKPLGH